MYQTLKIDIEPEFTYLNCITRLHDIFHVVANAVQKTRQSLVQLQNQVNHALHGMMSLSVIRPSELRDTLKKIKNRLPKHRVLPFSYNDQSILKYYKYLYPIIIPSGDKFLVILALPIFAEETKFDIVEVISVPVPKPSGNIAAYYKLETSFFAISKFQDEYAHLSEQNAIQCLTRLICKVNTPKYVVDTAHSCVVSLYLQNKDTIQETCVPKLISPPERPIMRPLDNRNWIISTLNKLEITLNCETKQFSVSKMTIMTGVHVINIDPGCSVHTRFFTIPAHFIGHSSLSIKGSFEPSINVSRISFDIWNHSAKHLDNFKAIESVLAEVSNHSKLPGYEMSINHLQAQLQQTQNDLHHTKYNW